MSKKHTWLILSERLTNYCFRKELNLTKINYAKNDQKSWVDAFDLVRELFFDLFRQLFFDLFHELFFDLFRELFLGHFRELFFRSFSWTFSLIFYVNFFYEIFLELFLVFFMNFFWNLFFTFLWTFSWNYFHDFFVQICKPLRWYFARWRNRRFSINRSFASLFYSFKPENESVRR